MAAALSRGALRWIHLPACKCAVWVGCQAARVLIPPPEGHGRQGVFCGIRLRRRLSAIPLSLSLQSAAVYHLRETSRDRNGDTKASCGFFMNLSHCNNAILHADDIAEPRDPDCDQHHVEEHRWPHRPPH
jgi:hypothetical protein